MDWNEICEKYNLGIHYDTLRKSSQFITGGSFVSEYYKWKSSIDNNENKYSTDLELQRRQIEKERQKLYAVKTEYSRSIRQQSRFELFYETVANAIKVLPLPDYKDLDLEGNSQEYILTIADIHAGANFTILTNSYSFSEMHKRFNILLAKTIQYLTTRRINHLKVLCLGDDIQGILRVNDLKLNESTVVEATVMVAKEISNFLNELSAYATIEFYHCPASNHSQTRNLGTKANELASEDIEYVIANYIHDVLINNNRISVISNFGYDYIEIPILNFKTIAMHGHQITNIADSLKNLTLKHKTFYSNVFLAHYHAAESKTVGEQEYNDCDVIVCPSFIGTCPYADRLQKGAKPSCMIYGFDEKFGLVDTHKILLNAM